MSQDTDYIFMFNKECLKGDITVNDSDLRSDDPFEDDILICSFLDPNKLAKRVAVHFRGGNTKRRLKFFIITDALNGDLDKIFILKNDEDIENKNNCRMSGIIEFTLTFMNMLYQLKCGTTITELEINALCVSVPCSSDIPPHTHYDGETIKNFFDQIPRNSNNSQNLKKITIYQSLMNFEDTNPLEVERSTQAIKSLKEKLILNHSKKSWQDIIDAWRMKYNTVYELFDISTSTESHARRDGQNFDLGGEREKMGRFLPHDLDDSNKSMKSLFSHQMKHASETNARNDIKTGGTMTYDWKSSNNLYKMGADAVESIESNIASDSQHNSEIEMLFAKRADPQNKHQIEGNILEEIDK